MVEPSQDDLRTALAYFWHPVCTREELSRATNGVVPVRLLGRDLAVAVDQAGTVIALDDRCLHRSTRLSIGTVEDGGIRCAYHGWKWDDCGRCVDIPSMPGSLIPAKAVIGGYAARLAYNLVWVCLDTAASTSIPQCPAFDDPTLKVVVGEPYTWPTAGPRRVENFVDLSHFAWVHDGSLGKRDEPVPPLPGLSRCNGELQFTYDPPAIVPKDTAMFGFSTYRMPMPCTVNIDFRLETGARRVLWMTASPIDDGSCRSFWFMGRDDDLEGPDEPHVAFQRLVLDEDEPVVCNQFPPEMPMNPTDELSVRTDRVSIEYRKWLREIVLSARSGPEGLRTTLGLGDTPQAVEPELATLR